MSEVLQLYENRMGDSAVPTVRFRLICVDGRWKTDNHRGKVYTAKGKHIFVVQNDIMHVTKARENRAANRTVNHVDLACGKPVQFAGEIYFHSRKKRGILREWNDKTGHYHDEDRPMDESVVPDLPQGKPFFKRSKSGGGGGSSR